MGEWLLTDPLLTVDFLHNCRSLAIAGGDVAELFALMGATAHPGMRAELVRIGAQGRRGFLGPAGRDGSSRLAASLDSAAFHSLEHQTDEAYQDEASREQIGIVATTVGFLTLIVGSLTVACYLA